MLAASYWSLLAPAIEMAEESGRYGDFAFFPVAVGFALGALFVYFADLMMPVLVSCIFRVPRQYNQCQYMVTRTVYINENMGLAV